MKCLRCGDCCTRLLLVEIDYHDVLREPKLAKYFPMIEGRDVWTITGHIPLPCPFLKKYKGGAKCSIYPTRPYMCVTWLPGCEQAKEKGFSCA